jgi:hypothetical protein
MKEVISEILQRKEQQEEDLYFETLDREVTAKMHRQAVVGESSGAGSHVRVEGKISRQVDQGRWF